MYACMHVFGTPTQQLEKGESMSLAQRGGSASGAPGSGSQSQLGTVTVSKLKRELEAAERAKDQ